MAGGEHGAAVLIGEDGGVVAAFLSGLFACKVMIALVKKAKLKWFALYCLLAGATTLICTALL